MNAAFSQSSESTSLSLLKRAKRHDPIAWQRLVLLYGPLVYRWCRKWGLSADDAPDVVQEVFRSVFRDLEGFQRRTGEPSFRAWLWTIARNRTSDFFVHRRRGPTAVGGDDQHQLLQELPAEEGDQSTATPDERMHLLHTALRVIRPDFQEHTWHIFWRTAIEGQETQEVARQLGMSSKAVRQAKHRVLKRLREELDGLID